MLHCNLEVGLKVNADINQRQEESSRRTCCYEHIQISHHHSWHFSWLCTLNCPIIFSLQALVTLNERASTDQLLWDLSLLVSNYTNNIKGQKEPLIECLCYQTRVNKTHSNLLHFTSKAPVQSHGFPCVLHINGQGLSVRNGLSGVSQVIPNNWDQPSNSSPITRCTGQLLQDCRY